MSAYLDASVLVTTLVEEDMSYAVEAYLIGSSQELLVSDFAATEVASALSRLIRMSQISADDASARLNDFDAWRAATSSVVELQASDARLAYAYVRRFDLRLRAPDALHLAICRRVDATLVTLDRRLATAAHELGIVGYIPDEGSGRTP